MAILARKSGCGYVVYIHFFRQQIILSLTNVLRTAYGITGSQAALSYRAVAV